MVLRRAAWVFLRSSRRKAWELQSVQSHHFLVFGLVSVENFSLCHLRVLCVSVVRKPRKPSTTETQRTRREHRGILNTNAAFLAASSLFAAALALSDRYGFIN